MQQQEQQLPKMGSEIRGNYSSAEKSFQICLFLLQKFKKQLLDSFKNFSNSFFHARRGEI